MVVDCLSLIMDCTHEQVEGTSCHQSLAFDGFSAPERLLRELVCDINSLPSRLGHLRVFKRV